MRRPHHRRQRRRRRCVDRTNAGTIRAEPTPIAPGQVAPSSPRSPRAGTTTPATSHTEYLPAASPSAGASESAPAAETPPAAAPAAVTRWAMVLPARLDTALASDDSEVDDDVEATLVNPVVVDGRQLVPAGTPSKAQSSNPARTVMAVLRSPYIPPELRAARTTSFPFRRQSSAGLARSSRWQPAKRSRGRSWARSRKVLA